MDESKKILPAEPTDVPSERPSVKNQLAGKLAIAAVFFAVTLIAFIPFYGIQFPPLVDLPEHLLISKLLWERLAGVSSLDLGLSFYLGYRLFPVLAVVLITFFKIFGISLLNLPKTAAMVLIAIHSATAVGVTEYAGDRRSWTAVLFNASLALPLATCMFSAAYFIGFVNYTLAVSLLIPAVFLTERFIATGKYSDAISAAAVLMLVYTAHPFAPAFWFVWIFSRTVAALLTGSVDIEWKRLLSTLAILLPVFLYHFFATTGSDIASPSGKLFANSPVIPISDWFDTRILGLVNGSYLRADEAATTAFFGPFAIGLILVTTIFTFVTGADRRHKTWMLSAVFLIFFSSWINEKFIPTPGIHWIAYEYRFSSTVYALGLAITVATIASLWPKLGEVKAYRTGAVVVAIIGVLVSIDHLLAVRGAYLRFDAPGREFVAKAINHESLEGIVVARSRWHPDGVFLKHYVCMVESDCVSEGTWFSQGWKGILYPVVVNSVEKKVVKSPLAAYWKLEEPDGIPNAGDTSLNGATASVIGTTSVTGKFGRGRNFNGDGDYMRLTALDIPNEIAVSVWVNSDRLAQDGFILTKNPVNTQWALFLSQDRFINWRGSGTDRSLRCKAPTANEWHHIVATQKGSETKLYIDGYSCATGSVEPIGNATTPVTIGRYDSPGYSYFKGQLDEVRIYRKVLTDQEVLKLYTSNE